jgi:hypothetical protein
MEGTMNMQNSIEFIESAQQYSAAYAAHYTGRDLPKALQLYRKLLASHPGTREADYAWSQIQNIVNTIVPKQELMDAQIELAVAHF